MPRVKWEELNEIIHDVKGILCQVTKIEAMCRKIKKDSLAELSKLEDIVLKQINGK